MLATDFEGIHSFILKLKVVTGLCRIVAGRNIKGGVRRLLWDIPIGTREPADRQVVGLSIVRAGKSATFKTLRKAGIEHAVIGVVPLQNS